MEVSTYIEQVGPKPAALAESVGKCSAVAYFFGRDLHKALDVHVGLIDSSVGGSPAEAWTSASALEGDPELKPLFDAAQQKLADYPKLLEQFRQELV